MLGNTFHRQISIRTRNGTSVSGHSQPSTCCLHSTSGRQSLSQVSTGWTSDVLASGVMYHFGQVRNIARFSSAHQKPRPSPRSAVQTHVQGRALFVTSTFDGCERSLLWQSTIPPFHHSTFPPFHLSTGIRQFSSRMRSQLELDTNV